MLDQSSYESFRVPTLNLVSRSAELIKLCEQVEAQKIPPRALQAPFEEFVWSLGADPVAKQIISDEVKHFPSATQNLNFQNPSELQSIYRWTQIVAERLTPRYRDALVKEILENYSQNEKDYLRKLLHSYCSLLIFFGWDERYILNQVETRFFTSDIGKIEKRTFENFFRHFEQKSKSYRIWIAIDREAFEYFRNLKFGKIHPKKESEIPPAVVAAFKAHSGDFPTDYFIETKIDRLDHFGAASVTFEILELLTSLSSIQKVQISLGWSKFAYAVQNTAQSGMFVPEREVQFQLTGQSSLRASAKRHKRQATTIINKLESASSSRTLQALKNVTLAQSSAKAENQLVLIWSAIENLLSDPPPGTARILSYSSSIAPCVCLNYARQYLCAIHDEINQHHGLILKRALAELALDPAIDAHTQFSRLVFDPANELILKRLFGQLSSNPLAINRIWKLRQNFEDPKSFLSSLSAHEQRVTWQIGRIYRARNELVHGGDPPRYLAPLVLNAFEYFKSTFFTLIHRAEDSRVNVEMDLLISSVTFDYGRSKADLLELQKAGENYSMTSFLRHFEKR